MLTIVIFYSSNSYFCRRNNDNDDYPSSHLNDWTRPRNSLANFWLETLRKEVDTPSTFQRAFSPRLSAAAEKLEQLHEPIDEPPREHVVYNRPGAIDNVASRRAQYLKEAFRSHSPSLTNLNG